MFVVVILAHVFTDNHIVQTSPLNKRFEMKTSVLCQPEYVMMTHLLNDGCLAPQNGMMMRIQVRSAILVGTRPLVEMVLVYVWTTGGLGRPALTALILVCQCPIVHSRMEMPPVLLTFHPASGQFLKNKPQQ